ncbi:MULTISPECIES: DUF6113 family protein [unclassified Streptomyces]|uniref:DUF6113 family protein n=1 Tax=unclassified Streptomyces TaxID=2593676 RepID=UPI002E1265EC|nr:DUF6113 family protein [Streptomyces sp. NBC_01197]WSS51491.1 DUF6113 family protein [Streptomyces sp. NBC_01180]
MSMNQGYTGMAAPPNPRRIAAYFGLAVLGALTGLAGALVQAGWFPGGLVLALLGAAAVFYGGRVATGTAIGAGAPAVGWLVAVILLTATRPEGDFVFGAGTASYVFLLGGMVAAVICATVRKVPRPEPDSARPGK